MVEHKTFLSLFCILVAIAVVLLVRYAAMQPPIVVVIILTQYNWICAHDAIATTAPLNVCTNAKMCSIRDTECVCVCEKERKTKAHFIWPTIFRFRCFFRVGVCASVYYLHVCALQDMYEICTQLSK